MKLTYSLSVFLGLKTFIDTSKFSIKHTLLNIRERKKEVRRLNTPKIFKKN